MAQIREALERNWWTLERFGFTPRKLVRRVANRSQPRVVTVSIPKSGTHLLERALCLHPDLYRKYVPTVFEKGLEARGGLGGLVDRMRPGQVVMSHLPYDEAHARALRDRAVRPVLMIRDPRDIAMALVANILRSRDHANHERFRAMDAGERVRVMIEGDESIDVPSIDERLSRFAGWLDSGAFVVRFEDLVGPAGGGTAERQLATVRALYEAIGVAAPDATVRRVAERVYSTKSPTFRKGSRGEWAATVDPALDRLFVDRAGRHLERYGYVAADR